jgi:hypothetical protein
MTERESLQEFAERMQVFLKNRQQFPEEELLKYSGQWIAWSPNGAVVLTVDADGTALALATRRSYFDPC